MGLVLRYWLWGMISLEKVDKFCYLGDMLDADGGCNSAVRDRVRSAWKKFPEYLPFLTGQEAQLLPTNPCDALRGQSRSLNIVPFHLLGIFHLVQ